MKWIRLPVIGEEERGASEARAIHTSFAASMDCFASLAMTVGSAETYFPSHFGGRFSENAFGPSM